jgi:hypothetical protein
LCIFRRDQQRDRSERVRKGFGFLIVHTQIPLRIFSKSVQAAATKEANRPAWRRYGDGEQICEGVGSD